MHCLLLQDEKGANTSFTFDKIFFEESGQMEVYQYVAQPSVRGAPQSDSCSQCYSLKVTSALLYAR